MGGGRSGDFRCGGGSGGLAAGVPGSVPLGIPVVRRRRPAGGDGGLAAVGRLDSRGVPARARDRRRGARLAALAFACSARRRGRSLQRRARRDRARRGADGAGRAVALNLNKLKRLEDAGLVALFDEDRKLWAAMAKDAYAYTHKFITG